MILLFKIEAKKEKIRYSRQISLDDKQLTSSSAAMDDKEVELHTTPVATTATITTTTTTTTNTNTISSNGLQQYFINNKFKFNRNNNDTIQHVPLLSSND